MLFEPYNGANTFVLKLILLMRKLRLREVAELGLNWDFPRVLQGCTGLLDWPCPPHATHSPRDSLQWWRFSEPLLCARHWMRRDITMSETQFTPPESWSSLHLALTEHSSKMAEFFSYLWICLLCVLQAFDQGRGSYWTAKAWKACGITQPAPYIQGWQHETTQSFMKRETPG